MIEPTTRQLAIVAFWARFTDANGYPPSFRDVMTEFGIRATNAIADHVRNCERKGLLARGPAERARATTITDLGRSLVGAAPPQRAPSSGLVIVESKCACGASFFVVGQTRCSACTRAA